MPDRTALELYIIARTKLEQAQQELAAAANRVLSEMEYEQVKTMKNDLGSFTWVQRHVPIVDEKGLRRALTARVFDKYTVRKLDKRKLEAAMGNGAVDPMVVAKYVRMEDGDPYLKYTAVKEEETS